MLFDITRPLYPGMPIYPGDPPFEQEVVSHHPQVSRLTLGSHCGTHLDAPLHVGLSQGVEALSLDILCGEVLVVGHEPRQYATRMLFKDADIPPKLAQTLVEKGVRLVGVEAMSIEEDLESHQTLLKAGVVIVEGLDLAQVPEGEYLLYCLPLKIQGDGAPVRAILETKR